MRLSESVLAAALLTLSACTPAPRPPTTPAPTPGPQHYAAHSRFTVPDTLDPWIEREMERRRIPGLALAIARAGEVLAVRAYGLADLQNQVPMSSAARFELGGLSRSFTAAGILLLVEDGMLDLEAPISKYLPDAPENWAGVTTRHLLNNTSGLPVIGRGFTGRSVPWPLNISTQERYDAARGDTLSSRPGETYAISDVGNFLLNLITERASGVPWREFLRTRIFEPLGMNDSYVMDQDRIHRNEVRGYTIRRGELMNIRRVRQDETPSGGIFSSVLDLVKWDAALHGDQLLSEASRTAMWTPARLADGSAFPYGFGWNVWCQGGHPVHHQIGAPGTEMVRLPGDSLTVIVLTNLGGQSGHYTAWGTARGIAELLVPTLAAATPPLTEAEREQIIGSYRYVGDGLFGDSARIVADDAGLYLFEAGVRIPLDYLGNDTFAFFGEPGLLVVERNAAGAIEAFRIHDYPAPRSGATRSRGDCGGVGTVGPLFARAVRVAADETPTRP